MRLNNFLNESKISIDKIRQDTKKRINKMSSEEAKQYFDQMMNNARTTQNPVLKELTGGYGSQSLFDFVKQQLAKKAKIIK